MGTLRDVAVALGVSVEAVGTPPRLFTRHECQVDCLEYVAAARRRVLIRTLALDLSAGSESVLLTVNRCIGAGAIRIEILVLDAAERLARRVPHSVHVWGERATTNLRELIDTLSRPHDARAFELEVRRYSCKPTVHGVRVEADDLPVRHFVTECQWEKGALKSYLPGEGEYVIAEGTPPAGRPRRLVRRFDQLFPELWASAASALKYSLDGRLICPDRM